MRSCEVERLGARLIAGWWSRALGLPLTRPRAPGGGEPANGDILEQLENYEAMNKLYNYQAIRILLKSYGDIVLPTSGDLTH